MEWFEKLDFIDNPFEQDPLKANHNLIARDDEAKEILYRIASGSMMLIEGKEGTGKTSLLKYAIDNFKGKGKVIYMDAKKLNKRLDIAKMLKNKKKGMILLLDNIHHISNKNNEKIKYFFDQDHIKSVVFTTSDYGMVNFSPSLKDRIGKNILKLRNMNQSDIVEIINDRLEKKEIIPENILKELFNSSKNLKEFMVKTEMLAKIVVEEGKQQAEKEDIKKLPKKKEIQEEDTTQVCKDCNEKLIKVKEEWRCENCDKFCKSCNAHVSEEDTECPACGAGL